MTVTHKSRGALDRARFFLEKAETCRAPERVDFEAFLEASIVFARAAIHRLKTKYNRHPGFKAWFDSLRGDPAIEFFRTERDWILKEAPPKIGQIVYATSVGTDAPTHVPDTAGKFYYFEAPAIPATATVARHLQALEACLAEAGRRFST